MLAMRVHNRVCLKCDTCDKEMVVFGNLYFCLPCFAEEFGRADAFGKDSIIKTDEIYEKWKEINLKKQEDQNEQIW